jgi:apolipoprotein N-acyltransferase
LFRAVETGRDLLIANNAGNSAIVDAFGRIIMRSPKRIHSCVSGTIYKRTEKTIYVRWGDIFALVCGGISLFTITYSFFYRIRKLAYHQN